MDARVQELLDIGLTRGEATVYLSLLELKSVSVGPLVKKSGVAYSNIYEILERLIKKGLATFVLKGGTKYFQAAPPQTLLTFLDERKDNIEKHKQFISKMLPSFEALQRTRPEQEAEIFIGIKGVRAAYIKLFSEKPSDWIFFYIHRKEYADAADRLYVSLTYLFKKTKSLRGICDEASRESEFMKKNKKFVNYKFVKFPIPGNIEVYHDSILIMAWSEIPVAYLLKSPQIASMMREYFESIWNTK